MNWKKLVREYFSYSDYEKKKLIGLTILLIIIICIRLIIALLPVEFKRKSLSEDWVDKAQASFSDPIDSQFKVIETATSLHFTTPDSLININKVSSNELVALGLSNFLAERFVNYRKSLGGFRSSSQAYSIYGIDSSWCDSLLKYSIPIDSIHSVREDSNIDQPLSLNEILGYTVPPKINLNTADSIALLSLKGLGPFYVKEIIKLRQNLGGIRDYSQLLEIYRMTDETISMIADQTFISEADFEYININTVDVNRLGRHPYVSWKQAKIIVNYRFQHGPFSRIEDLKLTNALNDSVYFNLRPYLVLE